MKQNEAQKALVEWVATIADEVNHDEVLERERLKGLSYPRIAVVGRSNVGKSSLINALLKTKLAQVSSQPGKTKAIYFYHWKEKKQIVADLPGYGFATTTSSERNRWERFIHRYLLGDPQLKKIVLLWDSRHAPVKADLDALPFFLDICEQKKIELLLVLTKTDQLKTQSERVQRKRIVDQFLKEQGLLGAPGFESVWVSVKSNEAKRAGKLLSNDGLSELLFKMTKLKVDKAEEVEEAETEETEGDL